MFKYNGNAFKYNGNGFFKKILLSERPFFKKFSRITLFISIFLMLFINSHYGHGFNEVDYNPPLLVKSASEFDYPPFAVVLPDGSADGFSVELLKAVTKAVGLKVNFTIGSWYEIKNRLSNGEIDVLPLTAYSKEREKLFDFSAPYLRMSNISVFVRTEEKSIHSYADLKDKEVLVMKGDAAHEYALKANLSENLIVTDTFEDAIKQLSEGRHDALLIQQLVGLQLIKKLKISNLVNAINSKEINLKPLGQDAIAISKHPSSNLIQYPKFEQKFCFAVRKGNHILLSLLNEGLAIVFADGTYNQLYNKWFTPILPPPPVPITLIAKYLVFIIIPLFLIIALSALWFLKREVARKTKSLINEMKSRQMADAQYKAADAQYKTLFNKMLNGFALHEIICDENNIPIDYRFLAVNPAFENITGLKSENIVNKTVLEVMPDTEQYWIDIYGKVALTGENITFENYSKEINKYFQVTSYQTEYMQSACIFKDITESKNAKIQEELLQKQLYQAQKMEAIGTLAGGISHDFNNILSPILGHTEMLLQDIPEYSPEWISLNEIYKAALRARDLVKQILAFARHNNVEIKVIKIEPVIKEAVKLIRATIPATIDIKLNIQQNCRSIEADPTQIHQIIMNLATNAFHAMETEGGELTISLSEIEYARDYSSAEYGSAQYGGSFSTNADTPLITHDMKLQAGKRYILIEFKDTGKGIPSEIIADIFDPFFTTKEKGKGTGLGLSVVHGIVKNMKGVINVYSREGEGTCFEIYFPAVEISLEEKYDTNNISMPKGKGSILLIDDEQSIVEMETKMLQKLGYQVTSTTSSIDALKIFKLDFDKFDIVITDMIMPKMSGEKLAEEMIKIRPDIPIIVCTGFTQNIDAERAEQLGIKAVFIKPIIMRELAEKIHELISTV